MPLNNECKLCRFRDSWALKIAHLILSENGQWILDVLLVNQILPQPSNPSMCSKIAYQANSGTALCFLLFPRCVPGIPYQPNSGTTPYFPDVRYRLLKNA